MTGIDKIKSKILEDAAAQGALLDEKAAAEARSILDLAAAEAAVKKSELTGKAESDGAEIYRRLLAQAGLEQRKDILRTKQELIDTAFRMAFDRICSLPDGEYQKLLEDMIVEAAGIEGGEIILSEKDVKRLDEQFLNNINNRLDNMTNRSAVSLSERNIVTAGGFILKQGDVEINGTFEILFGTLRNDLENEVVRILFNT